MTAGCRWISATVLAAGFVVQAFGGGFWIESGNPLASPEAKAMKAVLVLRVLGCSQPEKAELTGIMKGFENGKLVSQPLKLAKLSGAGMYAVTRQWSGEGEWALEFVAVDADRVTSAVFSAKGDEVDRQKGKYFSRRPTEEEVASVLLARP